MKYQEVIYGNYEKSSYPEELAAHLSLKYFRDKERIFDIGCGDGTYIKELRKQGHITSGIDQDVCYNLAGTKFDWSFDIEVDDIPFVENTFDAVFTKSTIEHVKDTSRFLSQAKRILKPEGILLILTPAWEYNYKWFYDDPTHVRPFHRKGLQDALKLAGFKEVSVEYFYHLPMTWELPELKYGARLLANIIPDCFRWKDKEQTKHNVLVRFCKEVQLLGVAIK